VTPAADLGLFNYLVIGAVWIAIHYGIRVALALFLNKFIKDRAVEVSLTAIRLSQVKVSAGESLPKLGKKSK